MLMYVKKNFKKRIKIKEFNFFIGKVYYFQKKNDFICLILRSYQNKKDRIFWVFK